MSSWRDPYRSYVAKLLFSYAFVRAHNLFGIFTVSKVIIFQTFFGTPCIGQVRIQIASMTPRGSRMRGTFQKRLINAFLYSYSFKKNTFLFTDEPPGGVITEKVRLEKDGKTNDFV